MFLTYLGEFIGILGLPFGTIFGFKLLNGDFAQCGVCKSRRTQVIETSIGRSIGVPISSLTWRTRYCKACGHEELLQKTKE